MAESKIVETLISFQKTLCNENPSKEDRFFVTNIEIQLAISIIKDLGEEKAKKLAKILLAMLDES